MVILNKLPVQVVETDTITILNRHSDRYFDRKGMEGPRPNAGK